jgi:hypothetical protein
MFIKISNKNFSITLCKLFFKSPINKSLSNSDYNWIYNMKRFNYIPCSCNNISECRSKTKVDKNTIINNVDTSMLKQISNLKGNYI